MSRAEVSSQCSHGRLDSTTISLFSYTRTACLLAPSPNIRMLLATALIFMSISLEGDLIYWRTWHGKILGTWIISWLLADSISEADWERHLLYSLGKPETNSIAQTSLECMMLLPQLFECWDYNCKPHSWISPDLWKISGRLDSSAGKVIPEFNPKPMWWKDRDLEMCTSYETLSTHTHTYMENINKKLR